MSERKITILVPTARPKAEKLSVTPRVHDLNGKVVGFLWNNKPGGDIFLAHIQKRLAERFSIAGTNWQRKIPERDTRGATVLDDMAHTCDVIINGVGD